MRAVAAGEDDIYLTARDMPSNTQNHSRPIRLHGGGSTTCLSTLEAAGRGRIELLLAPNMFFRLGKERTRSYEYFPDMHKTVAVFIFLPQKKNDRTNRPGESRDHKNHRP